MSEQERVLMLAYYFPPMGALCSTTRGKQLRVSDAVIAPVAIPVIFGGRWVEAGRKHVESEYNARIQGERLGAIYRDLVGGKERPVEAPRPRSASRSMERGGSSS